MVTSRAHSFPSSLRRERAEADVFLFPCLREDAGAVIAEARAVGLPIVCLARGGAPLLAGPAGTCVADSGGVAAIAQRLADKTLISLERHRGGDIDGSGAEALLLGRRAEALHKLLAEALPRWVGGARAPDLPQADLGLRREPEQTSSHLEISFVQPEEGDDRGRSPENNQK